MRPLCQWSHQFTCHLSQWKSRLSGDDDDHDDNKDDDKDDDYDDDHDNNKDDDDERWLLIVTMMMRMMKIMMIKDDNYKICDSNNINWFSNSAFLIEWPSVSINHHSLEKRVQNLVTSYMHFSLKLLFILYLKLTITVLWLHRNLHMTSYNSHHHIIIIHPSYYNHHQYRFTLSSSSTSMQVYHHLYLLYQPYR